MKKSLVIFFTLLSCSQLLSNDISWTLPPTTLSSMSATASDPQVALDANGDIVAAWVENGLIKASTKVINMSWSSAVTLSNTGSSSPHVVSAANGNATAVWLEGGVVKAATKAFGGNWSAAVALSTGTTATTPDLAIDSAGNVVAAWAKGGDIESSTKLVGQNWQTRVIINSTGAASPRVAMGGTGANASATVVWNGTANGFNIVYASNKLLSGTWSTQKALSDATSNAVNAHVAMDSNANAVATWYQYNVTGVAYSNVVVTAACRPTGGNWGVPVSLSSPGIRNPADLVSRIGIDANGNAIALWNTSFDGETFTIQSAVKPARAGWTDATNIVSSLYSYQADLAVSSLGDALTTYMFYNGAALQVQSAEANFSGFMQTLWSVPLGVSDGLNNGFPRVAAILTGNVINAAAVWINSNGVNTIQAITGVRNVTLPPSNPQVAQHVNSFGVFSEYYNTLSWSASTDPNLAGYVVFRNGVFLEQVGASVVQIIDDNRKQNEAVTYGVAAIDNQQNQSAIINVNFP